MPETAMRAALALALLTLAAGPIAPAPAVAQGISDFRRQQATPAEEEALTLLREANTLLETITSSRLEAYWRANLIARMARSQSRAGGAAAVRPLVDQTLLVLAEKVLQPPPGQLAPAVTYAILAQAVAETRDLRAAQPLLAAGMDAAPAITDVGARAIAYALLSQAFIEAKNPDGARRAALETLRAAVAAQPGSERVTALAVAALTQAELREADQARQTIAAAREELRHVTSALARASVQAHIARAAVAIDAQDSARASIRDALQAYDFTRNDTRLPAYLRVTTLAVIAVAQAEFRDRLNARATLAAAKQTLEQAREPAERFQGLIALVDALTVVERAQR